MTRRYANMAHPRPRPWRWYDTIMVLVVGLLGTVIVLAFFGAIMLTGRH